MLDELELLDDVLDELLLDNVLVELELLASSIETISMVPLLPYAAPSHVLNLSRLAGKSTPLRVSTSDASHIRLSGNSTSTVLVDPARFEVARVTGGT